MNNRKSKIMDVGPFTGGWDVDKEIGKNSYQLGVLVPSSDADNEMYNYWREQKIPWAHSRQDLFIKAAEVTKNLEGLYLDFGTLTGNCIKLMAEFIPGKVIYGFDSYQGYPEDFGVQKQGGWAIPPPTDLPPNAKLVIGFFQDTLSKFLEEKKQKINLIHIDCDLYDSTKYVLDMCYPYIQDGTYVQFNGLFNRNVFDEALYWLNDELAAWNDFVTEKKIQWKWAGSQGFSAAMIIEKVNNA